MITPIGTAKVDFLLESNREDASFSLYIDSDAHALTWELFESLTANIVSCVAKMSNIDYQDLDFIEEAEKAVGILLKGPPPDQLKKFLNNLGVDTVGLRLQPVTNTEFTPKLGQPIPMEWCHRLQSDIQNVFRSHEWVGYEDKENHFIFARVEYCIDQFHDTREEEGSGDEEEEPDIYAITTSEDDEEGRQVTVVELYKILRVRHDDGSREVVLYDPNGAGVQFWDIVKDGKLNSIMKKICQELKRIQKLKDKEQKRKAIKAMYLKWHPDKNPNPLATEAFKFLQQQIKRLEEGLDFENPDSREEHSRSDVPNPFWDKKFKELDNFARECKEAWEYEKENINESQSCPFDDVIDSHSVCPDRDKARIWFKQAEHDLKALYVLFQSHSQELYAHVCFMAHQVAEKALKAGMYKLIGLELEDLMHHELVRYARTIEAINAGAQGLEESACSLMNYYLNPRYPNRYGPSHSIPSDNFTRDQAIRAMEKADKIMQIIGHIVRHD